MLTDRTRDRRASWVRPDSTLARNDDLLERVSTDEPYRERAQCCIASSVADAGLERNGGRGQ